MEHERSVNTETRRELKENVNFGLKYVAMTEIYNTLYLQGDRAYDIEATTLPDTSQVMEIHLFIFHYGEPCYVIFLFSLIKRSKYIILIHIIHYSSPDTFVGICL
jgi:hypothetical protein